MTKIFLFILCVFSITNAFGKKEKKIKTATRISWDLCEKTNTGLDTTTTSYDISENIVSIYSNKSGYIKPIKKIIRTETISNENNILHQRDVYSDSLYHDIFTHYYKDSNISYYLYQEDTLKTIKTYFINNTRINSSIVCKNKLEPMYTDLILYSNHSNMRAKGIQYLINQNGDLTDSFQFDSLFVIKTFFKRKYNPIKNEWFVQERTMTQNRRQTHYVQYYNEQRKKYVYLSCDVIEYDQYGNISSKSIYAGLRKLCIYEMYSYEFY